MVSASFSCGVAVTATIVFFALYIPKGGISIDWWGNNVVSLGCDGAGGCPLLELPDVGYFGPPKGSFT